MGDVQKALGFVKESIDLARELGAHDLPNLRRVEVLLMKLERLESEPVVTVWIVTLEAVRVRLETHVLQVLAEAYEANQDCCYLPLRAIATKEISRDIIRAVIVGLRADGLVTYAKGLYHDDGEFAGSGYAITPQGRERLANG